MGLPDELAERFEVLATLGEGGFGVVLRARDRRLDRVVALKLLHDSLGDPEVARRFEREARLTAQLEHPHVVRVLDHGIAAGRPWIAYEDVTGGALLDRLEEEGPLRGAELREVARQVAGALGAIHGLGALHRDLKPENLLLRASGEVVICDLGIARSTRPGTQVTAAGVILGTPAYMAPEVLRGEAPSPASDQFSLAATLFVLATGRGVYGASSPARVLAAISRGWDAPACPELPGLRRALAPDPGARYPDLPAFVRGLDLPPESRADATRELAPGRDPGATSSHAPGAVPGDETTARLRPPGGPSPSPPRGADPDPARAGRWWVAPLAAAILAGTLAWRASRGTPAPPPPPPAPPAGPAAAGPADREVRRAAVEAAIAVLLAGHTLADGTLEHGHDAHIRRNLEGLLALAFPKRVADLVDHAAAWAGAEPASVSPDRDPLAWRVAEVLQHVLDELAALGRMVEKARGASRKLFGSRKPLPEATRGDEFAATWETVTQRGRALAGRLAPLDERAPDLALALRIILARYLGFPESPALLREAGTRLRTRGFLAANLGLIDAHYQTLRYHGPRDPVDVAARLEELRASAEAVARPPVTDVLAYEERRAGYLMILFRLAWTYPDRALPPDRAALGHLLDLAEALVAAGMTDPVHQALVNCPDWRGGWATGSPLATDPAWATSLERMRALARSIGLP